MATAYQTATVTEADGTTVGRPGGTVAYDLLLVAAYTQVGATRTLDNFLAGPRNPTFTHLGSVVTLQTYLRMALGNEKANFTFSGAQSSRGAIRISGADPINPINASAQTQNDTGATMTAPAVTPTVDNCLLVCIFTPYDADGTTQIAAPTGMTRRVSAYTNFTPLIICTEQLVGGAGVSTGTRTTPDPYGTNEYAAVTFAIAPDASTPDAIHVVGVGDQAVGTTTCTPTYPAGYTAVADDFAVVWLAEKIADTGEFTTPTGWTQDATKLHEVGVQDLRGSTYFKKLTAAEALPAWAGDTADVVTTQVIVLRGVHTTTPIDATSVTFESAAADQVTPTGLTTVTANAKVLSFVATSDDNALQMVTTQSFLALMAGADYDTTTGTDLAVAAASKQVAAPGAVTMPTWDITLVGTDDWVAVSMALRPASAAVVGPPMRRPRPTLMMR